MFGIVFCTELCVCNDKDVEDLHSLGMTGIDTPF